MTGERTRVLLVANRTAAGRPLLEAVRRRAAHGPVTFHLVVPATPHGLHRVTDPEDAGRADAERRMREALPILSTAAGQEVTGSIGDGDPLTAIMDAIHLQPVDEIILSTLPTRISRWLRLDLPSKVRALGTPVTLVSGAEVEGQGSELLPTA